MLGGKALEAQLSSTDLKGVLRETAQKPTDAQTNKWMKRYFFESVSVVTSPCVMGTSGGRC